jgi:VanZ family protein
VPEIQPWRNPRPAPHLPEIQARLRPPKVPAWLRAWWPALLWAAAIFSMSTDVFSSVHTGTVIEPILRWLKPSLTERQFHLAHYFIRKSAHFTEYFVFCLLLFRAVRGDRQGWRRTWGLTALF